MMNSNFAVVPMTLGVALTGVLTLGGGVSQAAQAKVMSFQESSPTDALLVATTFGLSEDMKDAPSNSIGGGTRGGDEEWFFGEESETEESAEELNENSLVTDGTEGETLELEEEDVPGDE